MAKSQQRMQKLGGRGASFQASNPRDKRKLLIQRTSAVFGIPGHEAEAMMSLPRRQSVRINPLSCRSHAEIEADLAPFTDWLIPIDWLDGAFHLDPPQGKSLPQTLFERGDLFIQNASSLLPVVEMDPQPGERILDLCASPGGKSSLIAALTDNKAELWLNDGIPQRIGKLNEVVTLLNVRAVAITSHPGQFIDRELEGQFDRILIDAQCTGEGMINITQRSSYQYWSFDRVIKYSILQRKMLMSASKLLKPGGTLVYSTCTFSPEENESPLSFLLKHNGTMRMAPMDLKLPELIPARQRWQNETFHHSVGLARRVKPSTFFEGFFCAKLRKVDA